MRNALLIGSALAACALCAACGSCAALFTQEGEAGWTTSTEAAPPLVRVIGD